MLRQFPVKSALPFPLPFGMIQRLARLLVQDLERGPVVGKRGKTDGNRNRTGHILMRDGRHTYPGQQALGGLFSDNARHNKDELIPADAGSHISIAELFSHLAGERLHGEFFPLIQHELALTKHWVKSLTGHAESLLQHDPRLRQSIRLRNPYIDPMSVLQVDLLRRWRASGREDEALLRALVASVNGVSQGLQNTG